MIYYFMLHWILIALLARNYYLEQERVLQSLKINELCRAYEKQILERDQALTKIIKSQIQNG